MKLTIEFDLILLSLIVVFSLLHPNLLVGQNQSPVKIFYGLNESHSDNWANCAPNGDAGLVYFKPLDSSVTRQGELIYKSISPVSKNNEEVITTGVGLEISILLFDANSEPHVFFSKSNDTYQRIIHCFREDKFWRQDTVFQFTNESGKYIYELSGKTGPNNKFHLCVLKTRSNPDSDDYYYAFLDTHLFYLTNALGSWEEELVDNYDMTYTDEEYVKSTNRQDIDIDGNGKAHIVFGEQVNGLTMASPSQLNYATNTSGNWRIETAVNYKAGSRDSGGWFPSITLDNNNRPFITCCYIGRVPTGSASYAKLYLVERAGKNNWQIEEVATYDDGYYGGDRGNYTGALSDLVFDKENTPHIIFSDIASSHAGRNYLNVGNIRYATLKDGEWKRQTVYRQPLQNGFYDATEMYGMCLLYSELNEVFSIIGQEVIVESEQEETFNLIEIKLDETVGIQQPGEFDSGYRLFQNYPNPFNPTTVIRYSIPRPADYQSAEYVSLQIYDILGNLILSLHDGPQSPGNYEQTWDAKNISSGVYLYLLQAGSYLESRKMTLLK